MISTYDFKNVKNAKKALKTVSFLKTTAIFDVPNLKLVSNSIQTFEKM